MKGFDPLQILTTAFLEIMIVFCLPLPNSFQDFRRKPTEVFKIIRNNNSVMHIQIFHVNISGLCEHKYFYFGNL